MTTLVNVLPLLTFKEHKQVVTDILIINAYATMSDPISYMPWMVSKDEKMRKLIWKLYNDNMISMEVAEMLLEKHYE